MPTARAFAANSATSPLSAASIPRRDVGPTDVEFEILFCGVCHSDLHAARNGWAAWPTVYPCVPGHEIVGRVITSSNGRLHDEGGGPSEFRWGGSSHSSAGVLPPPEFAGVPTPPSSSA